jgi:photosystem II stability/assembly factor-like uncharacterized protein
MKKSLMILFVLIVLSITSIAQWNQQTSGTTKNLWGVSFVDQNLGFVCGESGTILKTTDGGINWVPQNSGTIYQLAGIQFIDANIGYCASWSDNGGILLKTVNGGATWNNISLNIPNTHCGGMWFFDSQAGILALGDNNYAQSKILKTVNGGVSWETVYNGGNGWISFFHFPDRNNGYATMSGSRVLKTTDGGNNWTLLNNIGGNFWMSGVYFFDKNTGFVGGGEYSTMGWSIFKTTDGGASWQTVTNDYGTSIMLFTSSDIGFSIGGEKGQITKKIIIKTTTAGVSWTKDSYPSENSLNGISFVNDNVGFAVGDNGTILKYSDLSGISNQVSSSGMMIVYPNPALDFITLKIDEANNLGSEIKIYNITGTLVKSELISKNQQKISIADLSNGIYAVKIQSRDWAKNQKLIVQR